MIDYSHSGVASKPAAGSAFIRLRCVKRHPSSGDGLVAEIIDAHDSLASWSVGITARRLRSPRHIREAIVEQVGLWPRFTAEDLADWDGAVARAFDRGAAR